MIYGEVLKELQEPLSEETKKAQVIKALKLKCQNINRTIENLLNKKIRIDLEIKKQKTVLQNLKKQSSLELKSSLKLEDLNPLTREKFELLRESTDPSLFEEAMSLDQEIDNLNENLQRIVDLEALGALNQ